MPKSEDAETEVILHSCSWSEGKELTSLRLPLPILELESWEIELQPDVGSTGIFAKFEVEFDLYCEADGSVNMVGIILGKFSSQAFLPPITRFLKKLLIDCFNLFDSVSFASVPVRDWFARLILLRIPSILVRMSSYPFLFLLDEPNTPNGR